MLYAVEINEGRENIIGRPTPAQIVKTTTRPMGNDGMPYWMACSGEELAGETVPGGNVWSGAVAGYVANRYYVAGVHHANGALLDKLPRSDERGQTGPDVVAKLADKCKVETATTPLRPIDLVHVRAGEKGELWAGDAIATFLADGRLPVAFTARYFAAWWALVSGPGVELFAQDLLTHRPHLKPIHAMRDGKVCGLLMPIRPTISQTGDIAATWEANTGRTADVARIE
jgi:hypothetical protein